MKKTKRAASGKSVMKDEEGKSRNEISKVTGLSGKIEIDEDVEADTGTDMEMYTDRERERGKEKSESGRRRMLRIRG